MKIGLVGSMALVAGLVIVAAVAGVVVVMFTSTGQQPQTASPEAAAPAPAQPAAPPAFTTDASGVMHFVRSCAGALAEAKNIGVLPTFTAMDQVPPKPNNNESVCSAGTPSSHYDVAFFTICAGGGDACPVLARVTQDNQYVLFHRD